MDEGMYRMEIQTAIQYDTGRVRITSMVLGVVVNGEKRCKETKK